MLADYYKNKKVLVTGGCGFIGSHVTEALVGLGAEVTVLDDLSSGFIENINSVLEKITFIKGSITDLELCTQAVHHKDIIFHLAAFISVAESVEKPLDCFAINVNGTAQLLEAARKAGVNHFIFSSSASVYGRAEHICNETTPPNPVSMYGLSKLLGEYLCKEYAQQYNMTCVSLRYFNVWGERQNPHSHYAGARAIFSYNARHNLPITIFGDGLQTRDFIPVEQVVLANLIAGMSPSHLVKNETFNVATGNSISILQLIEQIKAEFPAYNSTITYEPARAGDVKHSRADITKFTQLKDTLKPVTIKSKLTP